MEHERIVGACGWFGCTAVLESILKYRQFDHELNTDLPNL